MRRGRLLTGGALIWLFLLLGGPAGANAFRAPSVAPVEPQVKNRYETELTGSAALVGGSRDHNPGLQTERDEPWSSGGPPVRPQAVTLARYVPACGGNSYAVPNPIDALCDIQTLQCGPIDDPGRQFYRYTTTIMSDQPEPPPGPNWAFDGTTCQTPADEAAAAAPVPITVSLADFRRLPLPPAIPTIEPNRPELLIRMRTNAYITPTSTTPTLIPLTLLGTQVQVRATPTTYTWDFGDGTTPLTTTDPGAPYPDLTTWHEYQTPGTYQVTLTTTYTGEYSIAGGPYQPIPGTATVTSPPIPLTLVTRNNRLTG